jgi:hypothetical protein
MKRNLLETGAAAPLSRRLGGILSTGKKPRWTRPPTSAILRRPTTVD